ncbi:MAG: inositol monophosphatase family protein [Lautropia sp.]
MKVKTPDIKTAMTAMTPSLAELDATADLLLAVADAEILPLFRRLGEKDIRTKSSAIDFVTVADEAAERVLASELRRMYPGAVIVGEEAVSADPGVLQTLAGAEFAITIDRSTVPAILPPASAYSP